MLMVSGFVYNFYGNADEAMQIYSNAINKANAWESHNYQKVSLCNIGIIEAEKDFEEYLESLN